MSLTLQEMEKIRHALVCAFGPEVYVHRHPVAVDEALEIVRREIHQMKQDQILSESKVNPT